MHATMNRHDFEKRSRSDANDMSFRYFVSLRYFKLTFPKAILNESKNCRYQSSSPNTSLIDWRVRLFCYQHLTPPKSAKKLQARPKLLNAKCIEFARNEFVVFFNTTVDIFITPDNAIASYHIVY